MDENDFLDDQRRLVDYIEDSIRENPEAESKDFFASIKVLQRAARNSHTGERKPKVPFVVFDMLFEMILEGAGTEEDCAEFCLAIYNRGRRPHEMFTQEMWKQYKHSDTYHTRAVLDNHEEHPIVMELIQMKLFNKKEFIAKRSVTAVIRKLNTSLEVRERLVQETLEKEKLRDEVLHHKMEAANMKKGIGEISESERKTLVVQACKEREMTQKQTSDFTGISIATVKRYWNSSG